MATMTVTTRFQNLNIRKGPSIQTPIVGNAARGSTVEVDTGRSQSSGGWVWLGYGSNKWICQKDPRYNYVFLTPKTEEAKTEPAKQEPPKQEPPKPAVDYDAIANALAATDAIPEPRISGIDGSAVMYSDQKYDAYQDSFIDLNEGWQMRKYQGMMTKTELEELDKRSSKYVQNDKGFPILAEFNKNGYYDYSWYMDYEKDGFLSDMPRLRHQLNYGVEDSNELMRTYTTHYNRFKLPMVGDALRSRFSHVFFVRPDLNILERGGSGFVLPEHIKDDPNYVYSYNHDIEMMRELVSDAGYDHDFSMYLSNRAYSFQLKDEGIDNGTYGEACTGYKIAFGRHNIASKTAGEFEITYKDDREYHIYRLHKLWVDYISGVYQGSFVPKEKYIKEKVATSVSTGNQIVLVFAAFIAVAREGAELILFFQGVPVQGASGQRAMILAIVLSVIILAGVFLAFRFLSVKLPLKPFFLVTSILMYVLCFSFTGKGVSELQAAGVVGKTIIPWMQSLEVDFLGIYATYESLIPQLVVLTAIIVFFVLYVKKNKKILAELKRKSD